MFYINFKNPHIMKKLLLLFAVCITAVSAAQNNFWQLTKSLDSRVSLQSRRTMPSDFQLHNLQLNAIQEHLSAVQRALNTTVQLDFPLANGTTRNIFHFNFYIRGLCKSLYNW